MTDYEGKLTNPRIEKRPVPVWDPWRVRMVTVEVDMLVHDVEAPPLSNGDTLKLTETWMAPQSLVRRMTSTRSVSTSREYAIACLFEEYGEKRSWTFWFERWVGTGTYWLCHQGYMPGAFRV